jgi:DNA invertase Pin-like site-specific DNA recombinase
VKEHLTFRPGASHPVAKMMLSIMGAVAEFERSLILERQREDIAIAKRQGAYNGGRPKLSAEQTSGLRERVDCSMLHATSPVSTSVWLPPPIPR